ncbi:MAG: winged helix-turn-helix domain-containing protein/riboflavin kinase [Archaeoglobaceae archaeon]|nr:winged helix-turn-helix domain-containing protein/riboflavin kinase [Archaeoglobaceae archaeon]MDW8118353.1 winged helix-turn-helix domain-containing protein/riboflavin kinase [Archaeoglobaceae archaeon]
MLEMLKTLALMNASREVIKVSCKDLGEKIGQSTQTASRRLKELENNGLIERNITKDGQFVAITEKGLDVLYAEYSDYRRIFEKANIIKLHCTVFSGLGEGSYYVSLEGYRRQFIEKLSIDPFPGTLNLRVAKGDIMLKKRLDKEEGIKIEGFSAENRTFGSAKAFKCKLNGVSAFIVIPQRTHYPGDVLEVISDKKLRDLLNLKDGDLVELEVIL